LPGHERPPKPTPLYKVEMGDVRRAVQTTRCPWSVALSDSIVERLLNAYVLIERWQMWPTGRRDPRLVDAMLVIADEHQQIDTEQMSRGK
jgi:hypothetical protein